jgi:hypothetical protein
MSHSTIPVTRAPDAAFEPATEPARRRSHALADRLELGARSLVALATTLTEDEWRKRVRDGRRIGVLVHHVASMYPVEIQLALVLAEGNPVTGVTWNDIHAINAKHAAEHDAVTKDEAIDLLRTNSQAAATAVRALTDAALDQAAPISLNDDAPLTCQFFIEDHALRHSYHHLAGIRAVLTRQPLPPLSDSDRER